MEKRGGKSLFLTALFLAVFLIIWTNPITAVTRVCYNCSNCSAEITASSAGDVIQLNNSLGWNNATCVDFGTKTGIIFNCQNYSNYIQGNNSGASFYGIYINRVNSNEVRNCNISGFYYGIYNYYSNNTVLTNITASNNNSYGMQLSNSGNITFTNIEASRNVYEGFWISSLSNSTFTNIISSYNKLGNPKGLDLSYAYDNRFINITVNNNTYGITTSNTRNNTFINITANNNSYGIDAGGNETVVINSVAYYNTEYGMRFSGCRNCILTNITANNNPTGIAIAYGSINTTLTNITANNNSGQGISSDSSNYTILRNIYTSYNSGWGVSITTSKDYSLTNLVSSNNTGGLYFYNNFNQFSNITNVIISDCGSGLSTGYFNNSIITNLTIINSTTAGITLSTSRNNTFANIISSNNRGNTASNGDGITIASDCYNNTFINITVNNNSRYGIISSGGGITLINGIIQENLYDTYFYENNCTGNFTNITGSGGRVIEYYNYPVNIQDKVLSQLILCNADNSNVTNVIISGSDTIKNNFLQVFRTDGANLTNIFSTYNYYGVFMQYSNNDTLTNIDARYNNNSGILLTFSNNSILSNLTINGNDNYGIYIGQAASYNTIRNSFIQDNRAYGILLSYSSTPSVNNLFYNNYFNNSVQYFNVSASTTIFFNTTKILGTNIVNRPYIGGNYWAAPNGSGFSQICNDTNGDYICDTAYNVGGLNYDYLPLYTGCIESWSCTSWSTCSGSVQTRTCTDLNSCGITISKPTESQSCNAGGGGTPSRSNPTETQTITSASAGGSASVEIKNPKLDIRNITIYPKTNISNASITVLKNETGDIKIAFPAGTIYQAFTINAKAIKNEDLNNVTIEFRVNKTWLTEQNLSYNQVILYRMPSSTENWEALTTISIRGDSKYYYFIAMSSGFSTFIILIKEIPTECIPSQMRCFNDELQLCAENNTWILTEKCQYGCKNQACFKKLFGIFTVDALFYSTIAVVTFGIIIVLYFLFKKVKRARR